MSTGNMEIPGGKKAESFTGRANSSASAAPQADRDPDGKRAAITQPIGSKSAANAGDPREAGDNPRIAQTEADRQESSRSAGPHPAPLPDFPPADFNTPSNSNATIPKSEGSPAESKPSEPKAAGPVGPQPQANVVETLPKRPLLNSEQRKQLMPVGIALVGIVGFMISVWILYGLGFFPGFPELDTQTVTLIQPQIVDTSQKISTAGAVMGVSESLVGAQATGTVQQLMVKQGDRVKAGQQLAVLTGNTSQDQVAQADQRLSAARTDLARLEMGENNSQGSHGVLLAEAQEELTRQQREFGEARKAVAQAQSDLEQAQSAQASSQSAYNRASQVVLQGVEPKANADQAASALNAANKKVESAKRRLARAQTNVNVLAGSLKAAQTSVDSITSEGSATPAPSAEELQTLRQRVQDAQQALNAARQQLASGALTAPFDGVVKSINTQVGDDVGDSGVLTLDTNQLEVRASVDQAAAQQVAPGQQVTVSSSEVPSSTFTAKVSQVGAAVDPATQKVMVDIVPDNPPAWLRAGLNTNVTIVIQPGPDETVVPASAIAHDGSRTVVFTMIGGFAVEKPVKTGTPIGQNVPVISGLAPSDQIVADPRGLKNGQRLQVQNHAG
jgi:multidrug efflux pump subunit AcrA (membrane-fusion protein)